MGEVSDETHLARELEKYGNIVRCIPRDAWREYVIEDFPTGKYDVPEDLKADINIICKWHHFYDETFVNALRKKSGHSPVLYWVWDYMYNQGFPSWHLAMAKGANLYLSNEGGLFEEYRKYGVNPYYFPMDVCDGDLSISKNEEKIYKVVFTGSYLKQGDRIEYLKEINKEIPVKIFAWNHEEWVREGFDASPAIYGAEFNKLIAQSKVVLGFSVEPHCWGYWSNRVGKVIKAGGTLLYQYAPGMERLHIQTFTTPKEAIKDIKVLLVNPTEYTNTEPYSFTSKFRMAELEVILEGYLQEGLKWNKLP